MKFFVCHPIEDETRRLDHDDRIQFLSFLAGTEAQEVQALPEARLYVVLSGMYLTYGYADQILTELEQAAAARMPILVVRPYGTGYVPAALRPWADEVCDFIQSAVWEAIAKFEN